MYTPTLFKEDDLQTIADLIRDYPLGLIISSKVDFCGETVAPDEPSKVAFPEASPLPFFFINDNDNDQPTLRSHMAKANPHWEQLASVEECLVVFQGENNYVTPSWYPSKEEHHRVVPTWNYEIVQIRGKPVVHESSEWLYEQVSHATNTLERDRRQPWQVTDAPEQFVDAQLQGIVGLEVIVTDIQGKWKMSQNKSADDFEGVKRGLSDPEDYHRNIKLAEKLWS